MTHLISEQGYGEYDVSVMQREIGYGLWQLLSNVFQKHVTKKNAKNLLASHYRRHAIEIYNRHAQSNYILHRRSRLGKGYIESNLPIDDALDLQMVFVPSGSFIMGSFQDEGGHEVYEEPQHPVTVSGFFMSRYPVTQAQWRAVAALEYVNRYLEPDPSGFKGADRPVEQVSWKDVVEFCQRLARHTGRPYRLPSEAEWEYACRAGTTTPFYFGETITFEIANYDSIYPYDQASIQDARKTTTQVNYFDIANAFGLCDMHGNVWEWCQDHWRDGYEDTASATSVAWERRTSKNFFRVRRGGSWMDGPEFCRSATRINGKLDDYGMNIGFRIACSAPRSLQ